MSLESVAVKLYESLPSRQECSSDNIHLITDSAFYLIGNKPIWSDFNQCAEIKLPEYLQNFIAVLMDLESLNNFYGAIAWDGMLSIFYNKTGNEIEIIRDSLRKSYSIIYGFFEEAQNLVVLALKTKSIEIKNEESLYQLDGENFWDCFDDKFMNEFILIEDEINKLNEDVYDIAISQYCAVARAAES